MNIGGATFGSPCPRGREQGKLQPPGRLNRLSPDAHREPANKPVVLQAHGPSLTPGLILLALVTNTGSPNTEKPVLHVSL